MGKPDVRVRLTAEGVQEVVGALKRIQQEADRSAAKGGRSFAGFNKILGNMKGLLAGIGAYLSFRAFQGFLRGGSESADQIGKLALRIGTTTERASALAIVLQRSDGDLNAVASAGGLLSRKLLQLEDGVITMVQVFGRLNLTMEDFEGLDTAEAMALIANRLSRLQTGSQKTAIAMELFGRSGAKLIPAFNELGTRGLPAVIAEAREMGQVLDQETADAVIYMNDQLANMQQQSKLLAAQFVGGLAPSVVQALTIVRGEVSKTSEAMKTGGATIGNALSVIIFLITTVVDLIQSAVEVIAFGLASVVMMVIAPVNAVIKLMKGDLKGAQREFTATNRAIEVEANRFYDRMEGRASSFSARVKALVEGPLAIPPPEPPPGDPLGLTALEEQEQIKAEIERMAAQQRIATLKAQGTLAANEEKRQYERGLMNLQSYYAERRRMIQEQSAAEVAVLQEQLKLLEMESDPRRRGTEESRVNAELERARLTLHASMLAITGEEEKAAERLADRRLKVERATLEAQGRTYEARLLQIQGELAAHELLLKQTGIGEAERAAELEAMATRLTAAADFAEVTRQAELALRQVDLAREEINNRVIAGLTSEVEANREIADLERGRLPSLQLIGDALLRAAEATSDPTKVLAAQEWITALGEMGHIARDADDLAQAMADLGKNVQGAAVDSLASSLAGIGTETENARQAMLAFARDFARAVSSMIARLIALQAVKSTLGAFGSLFSGGGEVKGGAEGKARGGEIHGPGTWTSDSILAALSTGEFVVRARAVQRPGGLELLHALNQERLDPLHLLKAMDGRSFARGGIVERGVVTPFLLPALHLAGGGAASAASARATGSQLDGKLVVGLDDGLILRSMKSTDGERLIVETVAKNRRALSRMWG